jgi:hypothetical protein
MLVVIRRIITAEGVYVNGDGDLAPGRNNGTLLRVD